VPLGQFDTPTQGLRVLDRQFDVLVRVSGPTHPPNPTPSVDTCQAKIAGDLERFSIAWMPNLAQRSGTRRTPLCPPLRKGGKRPDSADFPPLAKGGRGGESRGACTPSENRSKLGMARGLASSHTINGSELLDIEPALEQGSKVSIPVHEYTGTRSSSTRCSQSTLAPSC